LVMFGPQPTRGLRTGVFVIFEYSNSRIPQKVDVWVYETVTV
jgi:hypothetical protein